MAIFEQFPYTNFHELNLDHLLKDVTEVKSKAESVETYATQAEASSATAEDAANAAESYRDQAQAIKDSMIEPPRMVGMIGDSYAEGWNPDLAGDGWPVVLKDLLGLSEGEYSISAKGGTGFAYTVDNKNFITLIENLSFSDRLAVTDIIVAGGYNDIYCTKNEILAGMAAFNTDVRSHFPNARIWVGFIGRSFEDGNTVNSLYDVFSTYIAGCAANNFLYLNGVENSTLGEYFASDWKHPTINGNRNIAYAMYQILKTGYFTQRRHYETDLVLADEYTKTSDNTVIVDINDNMVTTRLTLGGITFNTPTTLTTDTVRHLLGSIPKQYSVFLPANRSISFPLFNTVRYNGYQYMNVDGYLTLENNNLYYTLTKINSAGKSYDSITNLNELFKNPTIATFTYNYS